MKEANKKKTIERLLQEYKTLSGDMRVTRYDYYHENTFRYTESNFRKIMDTYKNQLNEIEQSLIKLLRG